MYLFFCILFYVFLSYVTADELNNSYYADVLRSAIFIIGGYILCRLEYYARQKYID